MSTVEVIVRPEPLAEPVTTLDAIGWKLGLCVTERDYLAECGFLRPGQYAQTDARKFLSSLNALGSNQAVQAWLDANPLV